MDTTEQPIIDVTVQEETPKTETPPSPVPEGVKTEPPEKAPPTERSARVSIQLWKDEKALMGSRLVMVLTNPVNMSAPSCYLTGTQQQGPFSFVAIVKSGTAFTDLPGFTFASGGDGTARADHEGRLSVEQDGGLTIEVDGAPSIDGRSADALWAALGFTEGDTK